MTEVDGTFGTTLRVHRAARYVAVAGVAAPPRRRSAYGRCSAPAFRGPRVLGGRLRVSGRVLPHQAGRILVRAGNRSFRARVDRKGRFRVTVPAPGPGRTLPQGRPSPCPRLRPRYTRARAARPGAFARARRPRSRRSPRSSAGSRCPALHHPRRRPPLRRRHATTPCSHSRRSTASHAPAASTRASGGRSAAPVRPSAALPRQPRRGLQGPPGRLRGAERPRGRDHARLDGRDREHARSEPGASTAR